ncbi:MAG: hypothetical protein ACFFG0_03500 [Candidatus Thorarchaeota archaeon]
MKVKDLKKVASKLKQYGEEPIKLPDGKIYYKFECYDIDETICRQCSEYNTCPQTVL